jgi:hypothetical protein
VQLILFSLLHQNKFRLFSRAFLYSHPGIQTKASCHGYRYSQADIFLVTFPHQSADRFSFGAA